jgi:hypothetical protein
VELNLVVSSERLGTCNAGHRIYETPLPVDFSGASEWSVYATGDHGYHIGLCLPASVNETGTLRWRLTELNDYRDDVTVNLETQSRWKYQKRTALDLFFHSSRSELVITGSL